MTRYIQPSFQQKAFTCMFCGVLTTCKWHRLVRVAGKAFTRTHFYQCQCDHCHSRSLWLDKTPEAGDDEFDFEYDGDPIGDLILPAAVLYPPAHLEMPQDCSVDFEEARQISGASPRGAAALLRLCLQKLCIHLGGKGKNLNDDIGLLVKQGLAPQAQQALDVVRVTGNNAVHPGEISLEESPEHVTVMFSMINLIVEELISRPKQIAEKFGSLPIGALEAIAKRDGPKPNGSGD